MEPNFNFWNRILNFCQNQNSVLRSKTKILSLCQNPKFRPKAKIQNFVLRPKSENSVSKIKKSVSKIKKSVSKTKNLRFSLNFDFPKTLDIPLKRTTQKDQNPALKHNCLKKTLFKYSFKEYRIIGIFLGRTYPTRSQRKPSARAQVHLFYIETFVLHRNKNSISISYCYM